MDLALSSLQHRPWLFAVDNPRLMVLCELTAGLQWLRLSLRMVCVWRIFGPVFALGVPLRSFLANVINCFASLRATWRYFLAKRDKQKLVWQKTEHAYPAHAALAEHHRDFDEILINCGFILQEELTTAKQQMPAEANVADYLFERGLISDEDLCRALSLFTGAPMSRFDAQAVKRGIRWSLPAHVAQRFGIVPVDLRAGRLVVAGQQAPSPSQMETLKNFTFLGVDFELITRQNFAELQKLL
jgi:adsorption protein B